MTEVPAPPVIIATGPLTSDALSNAIAAYFGQGEYLNFFDAAAPLVTAESIDMTKAWFASRYDRGTPDYINCALPEEVYRQFVQELASAEEAPVHGFEDKLVFEGRMPVEVMARRGLDTLRYGRSSPSAWRTRPRGGSPMPSSSCGRTMPPGRSIIWSASRPICGSGSRSGSFP